MARRRSFATAVTRSPVHLVDAFAAEANLMLGQVKVDDRSNVIKAAPALLALPDLDGRIRMRRATVCHDTARLQEVHDWPGLAAIDWIGAARETASRSTTRTRCSIACLREGGG